MICWQYWYFALVCMIQSTLSLSHVCHNFSECSFHVRINLYNIVVLFDWALRPGTLRGDSNCFTHIVPYIPSDRPSLQSVRNNGGRPGPWFSIKMTSYQYRKSHCGDKTILRPCYLHNGICYTGKMSSLYWTSPQCIQFQRDINWVETFRLINPYF